MSENALPSWNAQSVIQYSAYKLVEGFGSKQSAFFLLAGIMYGYLSGKTGVPASSAYLFAPTVASSISGGRAVLSSLGDADKQVHAGFGDIASIVLAPLGTAVGRSLASLV